jgi:hypothetical protein
MTRINPIDTGNVIIVMSIVIIVPDIVIIVMTIETRVCRADQPWQTHVDIKEASVDISGHLRIII